MKMKKRSPNLLIRRCHSPSTSQAFCRGKEQVHVVGNVDASPSWVPFVTVSLPKQIYHMFDPIDIEIVLHICWVGSINMVQPTLNLLSVVNINGPLPFHWSFHWLELSPRSNSKAPLIFLSYPLCLLAKWIFSLFRFV
jgi:hypothetical protein